MIISYRLLACLQFFSKNIFPSLKITMASDAKAPLEPSLRVRYVLHKAKTEKKRFCRQTCQESVIQIGHKRKGVQRFLQGSLAITWRSSQYKRKLRGSLPMAKILMFSSLALFASKTVCFLSADWPSVITTATFCTPGLASFSNKK